MLGSIWTKIEEEIKILRVGAMPGIVVTGVVIIARALGYFQHLELAVFDNFLCLRPAEPVDERITIVGINEADIRSVGTYPIPDREIAALLRKLQSYKPKVIGLDIVRDLPVEPGHASLVAAFKDIDNLIAIEKVLPAEVAPPPTLPPEQVGFADAILDADGHLRRSLLGTPTPKGYRFSLSLRLAKTYLSSQGFSLENGIEDPKTMRFGATEIPRFVPNYGGYVGADAGGIQVLLNFRNSRERFRIVSLNDIKTGKVNSKWLRDRIIIIGLTAPSVKDIANTSAIASINPAPGTVYGVEIQAHAVSQIISAVLDKRPLLKVWSDGWEYLWILFWGVIGISFGRLTQSPLRNVLGVLIASISLIGIGYSCIILGWWIPVAPATIVLIINGIGLTAFYQYDRALRSRISDRQFLIERTFDTIHNGPLQTLAKVLRSAREENLPADRFIEELETLNYELRAIYEFMQKEPLTQTDSLYLGKSLELNLQAPIHEILYQVYTHTLERDLPCFKTLKVKIYSFEPIDNRQLNTEQKRGICRFLEEALCNVGKHATGVTRLVVTCAQKENCYILSITDNGQGIYSSVDGRGTQQFKNLARQLRGKFTRKPLSPKGTLCELTWPVRKYWLRRFWRFRTSDM